MKKAIVYFKNIPAGMLEKNESGFSFSYFPEYLNSEHATPIAYTFPLRVETYRSGTFFPFFQNLVSEGWLMNIQCKLQKIDKKDFFKLLVENGRDLSGAVSIEPVKE